MQNNFSVWALWAPAHRHRPQHQSQVTQLKSVYHVQICNSPSSELESKSQRSQKQFLIEDYIPPAKVTKEYFYQPSPGLNLVSNAEVKPRPDPHVLLGLPVGRAFIRRCTCLCVLACPHGGWMGQHHHWHEGQHPWHLFCVPRVHLPECFLSKGWGWKLRRRPYSWGFQHCFLGCNCAPNSRIQGLVTFHKCTLIRVVPMDEFTAGAFALWGLWPGWHQRLLDEPL